VSDEQALLTAWRGGDEDAGEVLFERYYDGLARFFRSKAGEHAPDLIQRTFLVCLETQSRMREGTTFQAYLFGVARHILLEHYRGKRRDGDRFDASESSVADLGPTPTTLMAREQETQLLLQALRRIPLESQMILELYYWENLTAKDIGDVLEIPEGTARTRIRRAKQLLETQLSQLASSPALLESTVSDLESWARHLREELRPRK
jgi:RNA polymerase sigma factor (sigma-70 family)